MQDIHDIKPLIDVGIWDTRLPLVIFVIVLASLVFLGYALRERYLRRKAEVSTPKEPKKDIAAIIDAARSQLQQSKESVATKNFKQTYIEITRITKECVSDVYALHIESLTTSEISQLQNLPKEVTNATIRFLQNIDRLKFDNVLSEHQKAIALCDEAESVLMVVTKNIEANSNDHSDSKSV